MKSKILDKLSNKAKETWNETYDLAKDNHSEERAEKIAWSIVKNGLENGTLIEPVVIKSEPIEFKSAELVAKTEGDFGGKEYFLEGYLATGEIDRSGSQLSPEFLEDMGEQIRGSRVNIKGDLDHVNSMISKGMKVDLNDFLTTEDIMVIKEAEIRDDKLWVKVLLNKHVKNFDRIWYDIQNGFKDSFSVEYYPKAGQYEMKPVGDKLVKYVKGGDVHRFCLTGNAKAMIPGARVLKKYVK